MTHHNTQSCMGAQIQSINQNAIAPISVAQPGSVARRLNQCSTGKSMEFHTINGCAGVYRGGGGGSQDEETRFETIPEDCN